MVLKYDDDDEYPCGREKMRGENRSSVDDECARSLSAEQDKV